MLRLSTIKINQPNKLKFFGYLESQILDYLWRYETMTVRDFYFSLYNKQKNWHPNTINTVLKQMIKKNLIKKQTGIKENLYSVLLTKEKFKEEIKEIILILEKIFKET